MKKREWKSISLFLRTVYCTEMRDEIEKYRKALQIEIAVQNRDRAYLIDMLEAVQIMCGEMIAKLKEEVQQ